ncbi:MAG: response regulator, partial [Desulfatitalea sp.]|nr:response regulator [Desulfatitalea sp.]
IPATVAIEQEIAPNVAAILANPIQIHQVVMNLCTNAAHAMLPDGGLLRVCLDHWRMDKEALSQHGPIAAGDYVRLRVSDTGTGMSAELVQRIFEPFFTTKPQGEGTGMGLSVVLGVVQAHDGAIRVRSTPGEGSCFEVLLPVATRTAPMDMTAAGPPPGGTERILLVDDESALLHMGNQVLSKLGYRVTVAQDPREALALFDREPRAFDLVITDLTMPHLIGTELARRLLAIRPDLPILLCTGYGDAVANGDLQTLGIRELILKPLLRSELAVAIRRALAAN